VGQYTQDQESASCRPIIILRPAEQLPDRYVIDALQAKIVHQKFVELGFEQVIKLIATEVPRDGGLPVQRPLKPHNRRTEEAARQLFVSRITLQPDTGLAPITVDDIKLDVPSGVRFATVIEDTAVGRSVKTKASVRAVPLHSELLRIGFMDFVEHAREKDASSGRLFPEIERGPKGTYGEVWSKWFGRYKRSLGIDNENSVFHSFRHGFKDALRAAQVSEDINDALTGHAGGNRVSRGYGWKDMVRRFGFPALHAAVEKVAYPGLDLSRLQWLTGAKKTKSRS